MKWITIVSGFLCFAACSGGSSPSGPTRSGGSQTVATITVTPGAPSFASLGESVTLTAVARDASGDVIATASFTWSSSDPSIVRVDETANGARATALTNGAATITVTSGEVSITVSANVAQAVANIDFSGSVTFVEFSGETAQLAATPIDARGNTVPGTSVTWSSSNPAVATVDVTGVVTARDFGTAVMTATSGAVTDQVFFEVLGDRFFLNGSVRLRYDLDLPDGSGGPFPAVVWVHGSGMLNRNSQAVATNRLVPEGLAVLRYDKRGVGESTGSFFNIGPSNSNVGLRTLAGDAAAGVARLKRFPQIDPDRIGIMGNSQGGWIGPLAAAQSDDVSFMMMWSGPTVSVGLEIFYSNLTEGTGTPLDDVYPQLSNFNGVPGYDPLPTLESLDIPSLWLYGGMDRSIPTRLDSLNMRHLQALGLPYEFVWFPTGRHDLRDNDSGMGPFLDVWSEYLAWMRRIGIL
jgi:pimeloyl-ACP methyl ester carboxylesterase